MGENLRADKSFMLQALECGRHAPIRSHYCASLCRRELVGLSLGKENIEYCEHGVFGLALALSLKLHSAAVGEQTTLQNRTVRALHPQEALQYSGFALQFASQALRCDREAQGTGRDPVKRVG